MIDRGQAKRISGEMGFPRRTPTGWAENHGTEPEVAILRGRRGTEVMRDEND